MEESNAKEDKKHKALDNTASSGPLSMPEAAQSTETALGFPSIKPKTMAYQVHQLVNSLYLSLSIPPSLIHAIFYLCVCVKFVRTYEIIYVHN